MSRSIGDKSEKNICELYKQGYSMRKIADLIPCSPITVKSVLVKRGLFNEERASSKNNKINPKKKKKVSAKENTDLVAGFQTVDSLSKKCKSRRVKECSNTCFKSDKERCEYIDALYGHGTWCIMTKTELSERLRSEIMCIS